LNYIFETLAKIAAASFSGLTADKLNKEKRNLIISLTKSKQNQRYGSNIPEKPKLFIHKLIKRNNSLRK